MTRPSRFATKDEYVEAALECLQKADEASDMTYEPWQYWTAVAQVYATLAVATDA